MVCGSFPIWLRIEYGYLSQSGKGCLKRDGVKRSDVNLVSLSKREQGHVERENHQKMLSTMSLLMVRPQTQSPSSNTRNNDSSVQQNQDPL
jgi:hypothetical protein